MDLNDYSYAENNEAKIREIEYMIGQMPMTKMLKLVKAMNQQIATLEYKVNVLLDERNMGEN